MIKLFSKYYTIRFVIARHLLTPHHFTEMITNFCKEKNINTKWLYVTTSIVSNPNSPTIIKPSFVTIRGNRKDFETLNDFLFELEESKLIVILTV